MKPQLCAPKLRPIQNVVYAVCFAWILMDLTNSPTTLPTTGTFVAACLYDAAWQPNKCASEFEVGNDESSSNLDSVLKPLMADWI